MTTSDAAPVTPRLPRRPLVGAAGRALWLVLGFALAILALPQRVADSAPAPASNARLYFSPGGGAKQATLAALALARREILVAMYYFTDPDYSRALIAAHQRGVTVKVVLDRSQRRRSDSQARRLLAAGVAVRFDADHQIFHHKFAIIDSRILITGSMNWTRASDTRNAENLVIFHDPTHAEAFRAANSGLFDW